MTRTLLATTLVVLGMAGTASAQGTVIKTMETSSGDCLVAEAGSVTLVDGDCATYLETRGADVAETDAEAGEAPTRSRSITTSTVYAPG